ncbi:MAG TPA: helical backbone metal receptor [Parafilimonas sp.]|nr:helical backbone metal receptor [Parafilimonas sp.]
MQRIISLVPSQTELLYDLGLDEEVIGITKFCVHPEKWFRTKTRIGGTKNINIEKILSLEPDLVIANKEENVKEQIEALQKSTKVYVSDVANLADAKNMILHVGGLVGRRLQAGSLVAAIESNFSKLETIRHDKIPAAYFIWRDPYMAAGGDTFINDMMNHCGFENIFRNQLRYPEIAIEEIKARGCKIILLSSEPFPFKQKHIDELQPLLPETKMLLVNGEMFSWYGSRLLYAPDYFRQLDKMLTL